MNGRRCALILIAIGMHCWAGVPIASSQNLMKEYVEKAAAPLVEDRVVDGLSIGFIEGEHFGIVHLGTANGATRPADFRTLYEIGSISKVFTSLLLADAVVRGEIDLNAAADVANPAGIRLPSRDGRSIQWIDLSTHRSGLPRLASNFQPTDRKDPYHDYDSKRAATFLNQYTLTRPPGESREYSNFGVSVLGYLIAEKVDKSYEELLQERIAEPLGMTDSTVSLTGDQKKRLATPHDKVGSTTSPWTFADLPGAGGIRSTMRDMMRFAKAQLNPPTGTLGEAIELAWQQHREADASGSAMGLGWIIHGDGQTRWHNGGTGGSSSAIFINRQHQCAVIVLCNTSASNKLEPLAMQLIAKAAGRETKAADGERNGPPPKLSPFTAVQFEDEQVIVTYDGQAYEWLELDGIQVEDIVASSKQQFGGQWQKRIREDLVELLWGMDHRPGKTVNLRLRDLNTKRDVVVERALMSEENRYAVKANREQAGGAAPVERGNDKLVIDAKLRSRLVGRYQLTPNFIFDVQDRDGRLMVGITNQPTQEVSPDSPTRWTYPARHATLEFILPKVGAAGSLVLHQDGAEQTAYRIDAGDDEDVDDDADKLPIDASLRRRLTGRYQLAPNFIFTVRDRDGHLMVSATDQPTQEVFPDSPTRWSCRGIDATLEFKLPKTGRARSLILHQNGMEQSAPRIK
jgi:CubicO group peptidase (beta-lactamase class C family)